MSKRTSQHEMVDIRTIKEGERFRKDYDHDHMQELMQSILADGLMQPIGIDENNELIWGGCRFKTYNQLDEMVNREGHQGDPLEFRYIPCIRIDLAQRAEQANEFGVVGQLHQIDPKAARDLIKVQLEQVENNLRRDFTDSEKYAIAKRVEELQVTANAVARTEQNRQTAPQRTDYKMRNAIKEQVEAGNASNTGLAKELGCSVSVVTRAKKALREGDSAFFDQSMVLPSISDRNSTKDHEVKNSALAGEKAGEAVGISRASYSRLKKVQETGSPALIQARDDNKVSRSAASEIAELSPELQATIDFDSKKDVREAQLEGQAIIQARKDSGEEARGRKKVTFVEVKVKSVWIDADDVEEAKSKAKEEADKAAALLVQQDEFFSGALYSSLGLVLNTDVTPEDRKQHLEEERAKAKVMEVTDTLKDGTPVIDIPEKPPLMPTKPIFGTA